MIKTSFTLREIQAKDNPAVARLIREVMTEFGATGQGYSINDPEVDAMYEAYNNERSAFFVIENGDKILGCGGIGPLKGGEANTCELKKMYFYPELRGQGQGQRMLEKCLEAARAMGYSICYLETISSMAKANRLYQKAGFKKLEGKMGNTGHSACNAFYTLEL